MQTPYFEISQSRLLDNWSIMSELLKPCIIHYALKANSDNTILSVLANNNGRFDVASAEEFELLLSNGVSPHSIICSLPVKSINMIDHLYSKGCRYFVFDCLEELEKLICRAPNAKKILRIDVDDLSYENIQYGMDFSDYRSLCSTHSNNIDGFTFSLSGNTSWITFYKALQRIEAYIKTIDKKGLIINIGGGFLKFEQMENFFYKKWKEYSALLINKYDVKFYAEPGRAISKDAGFLVTTVNLVRTRNNQIEVFIDAGQQTKITQIPTQIECISNNSNIHGTNKCYHFYGPLCSKVELFSFSTKLEIKAGDRLRLNEMGAYSNCFASHWHALPIAPVILIE